MEELRGKILFSIYIKKYYSFFKLMTKDIQREAKIMIRSLETLRDS